MNATVTFLKPSLLIYAGSAGLSVAVKAVEPSTATQTSEKRPPGQYVS